MENEVITRQKEAQCFARTCEWFKALVVKFKEKVILIANRIKKVGQDDPRRITHSLKVGLALTIVSLLYYVRPLYDGFGVSGMWAILTVVVVFEFTVGGTLSKSLNRGFATLLAGALGVGAQHLASLFGDKGEPIVLGILVFLLAATSTFSRFVPGIKKRYDYGMLIFILTFSLVSVSGYRIDELVLLAKQRLSTILIGGASCMVISLFICPVWAGEDLHNLIASNIDKLGSYLEGFGGEYIQCNQVPKDDKSFLQTHKSILSSKSSEESLANFARWEPGHGEFRLRHPWKHYLKIGGLARQCAYQIEALNGYIISDIKVSQEFKGKVQESCVTMSIECGKALKNISTSMKKMKDPSSPAKLHIENSKIAIQNLKTELKTMLLETEEILTIIRVVTAAYILIEIVKCVEEISKSVDELYVLAKLKVGVDINSSTEKPHLLHRGSINPIYEQEKSNDHVVVTVFPEIIENSTSKQNHNPPQASQNSVHLEL